MSRRRVLRSALQVGASGILPGRIIRALGADVPVRGGQIIVGQFPESSSLTNAMTSAGPTGLVSGKIFDGLLTYDFDLTPRPQLATAWEQSSDGLTITFRLRPGVTWHDGNPFTAADVAFSATEVWKKLHSRGRTTFANLVAAETPDPLTLVFRLSKPQPSILRALASTESQILPRHLYEGTDVRANPHNVAPVGTGPFRFVKWDHGNYIVLERNPDYWDHPKPYLDRLIFRVMPDAFARSAALQTGEVDIVGGVSVALSDIARLARESGIAIDSHGFEYTATIFFLEFNLDRPMFKDLRVRRAFAHAIDREFIIHNIFFGRAVACHGPVPPTLAEFYTPDLPIYPYDLDLARRLLDDAGCKPDADGVRLTANLDAVPGGAMPRIAEYLRDNLGRIGIKFVMRGGQDFASYVRRIYTERNFDAIVTGGNAAPDPAMGVQRFYWSKGFQPGVAFSNASHYASAETDCLLEAAQTEIDVKKRSNLYGDFQRKVMADLPTIPLVAPAYVTLANRRVRRHTISADGLDANLAEAYVAPS